MGKFKALQVSEIEKGKFITNIAERDITELPDNDVLIKVSYSSLNYKDALSASGNRGVTKKYPHTPGIDAAGYVVKSKDNNFNDGDKVLVTGYDLGMNTSGGFGEYISVPSKWVVPLPANMTLRESMMYGTAGFTAALSLIKLQEHDIFPDNGEIVITGASGGVGTLAVAILSKSGYQVVAVTGKTEAHSLLLKIGATRIVDQKEVDDSSGKPLLGAKWAGAIDTVGGNMLATVLKSIKQNGFVASCGNAASFELNTTVFPFILRGITLSGIDSAECPHDLRLKAWSKLANQWKINYLDDIAVECSIYDLEKHIINMLNGKSKGRILVTH